MPTMRQLDAIDRHLLAALQEDARLPIAALGRVVGLSRTATMARVRHLEAAGAIRGYHADIAEDPAPPTHVAHVGIVLEKTDVAAYVRRLTAFPELREASSVTGEYDLLIRLDAAGAERLDVVLDRINGWRETVRTTTWIVLTRYR